MIPEPSCALGLLATLLAAAALFGIPAILYAMGHAVGREEGYNEGREEAFRLCGRPLGDVGRPRPEGRPLLLLLPGGRLRVRRTPAETAARIAEQFATYPPRRPPAPDDDPPEGAA